MKIQNILLGAIALLGTFSTPVSGQNKLRLDGVAAVVGKDVILDSDIDNTYMQMKGQGADLNEGDKCRIFEELMFEKLLAHQAVEDSLELTEGEIATSVERRLSMLEQQLGSMEKVVEYYGRSESDMRDEMYDIIKSQLLAQKMQQEIIKDVDATPEEVRNFYNSIPSDSLPVFNKEYELSQLVIKPKFSEEARQEVVDKLNGIKEDILNGSSFKSKAILYSEDPGSASKGGRYDGIKRGQFVKEFEAVAFNLQENEISDPVETEFGFHLIQLIKKRGEQLDLRHILIRPRFTPEDMMEAERLIDSIRSKIMAKDVDFVQAVKEFSDDKETRFNNGRLMNPQTGGSSFEVAQLDRNMYYAVSNLGEGEVSRAVYQEVRSGGQYVIYMVSKLTEPHKADYSQDFTRLKQLTIEKKKMNISEEWKNEKIRDTYIQIDESWKDCIFDSNWLKENTKRKI